MKQNDPVESKETYRVVHVFPNSARAVNGPCNAALAFLESLLLKGVDVRGLSPIEGPLPEGGTRSLEGLPIREVEADYASFISAAKQSVEGGRSTVFHFNGITPLWERLGRELRRSNIPYVFTSHGQLLCHGSLHWLKKAVYLNLLSGFIRQANGLHMLTQREREKFRWLMPGWTGNVLVHPNVVRVPEPERVTSWSRAELDIPARAFVFGYLGRLDVRTKGLDLLVKAFARVPGPSVPYLLLVGPDHAGGQARLRSLARGLGCDSRVRFLGAQIGEAKWRALKMVDAFVSPSRWEAFSLAQAEAIGFGIPTLVSSRLNVAPEFLKHRVALAARPSPRALAHEMAKLMATPDLRRSLGEAGRKWVQENCSLAAAGARFAEFYSRVIAART